MDAAVAEPVVTEVPTAEPVTEAPPNPEEAPVAEPEGGVIPEPEGGQGDGQPAIDLSAAEELIAAEVERRVAERAEKAEAEAAKRGLQRTKEADDGEAARLALYATAEAAAQQSVNTVYQLAESGELDQKAITEHFRPIIAGVGAKIAKENEIAVKALIEAALPEQTEAEKEALEPLLYEFRRNGRFDKLPATVTDLALARKDAEIKDLKKQLADRTAIRAAAEKLAAAANGAGPGVGAETPKGRAPGVMSRAAFEALPLHEQEKVPPAERRKIYEAALVNKE